MDHSFFEFRNETMDVSMRSDCDSEDIIDNSVMEDESFTLVRKPLKNQTATVVEESDESPYEDDEYETFSLAEHTKKKKSPRRSSSEPSITENDDRETNSRRQSNMAAFNPVILTSSSEDELSPEIVPKRRPVYSRSVEKTKTNVDTFSAHQAVRPKSTGTQKSADESFTGHRPVRFKSIESEKSFNESFIGRKGKKVMVLQDSESEEEAKGDGTEDDIDEDEIALSAATRMSIMGFRPKDLDSDESDFIQTDESDATSNKGSISHASSVNSLTDLPFVDMTPKKTPPQSPKAANEIDHINDVSLNDADSSKLSCSSFGSPEKDATMELNNSTMMITDECSPKLRVNKIHNLSGNVSRTILVDLTNRVEDDEVMIVDSKTEVIDVSSDDENRPKPEKKSPRASKKEAGNVKVEKSPTQGKRLSKTEPQTGSKTSISDKNTIKQYLVPDSYPNQGVVYVKKKVRDNELSKLEGLKEDLYNVKHLLGNMDAKQLPDGGAKLELRVTMLQNEVKRQAERVAAMLVEPDNPTAEDIAKDGFGGINEKGLSWDDIQAVSNRVQPKMFGKQAMSTHMAERGVILERLRALHESLASRPAETEVATQPASLRSALMPHQLHALAWLRWRETQRPSGGILADDMGLGKTITMIALVASSKDSINEDEDDDRSTWKGKENTKLIAGGTLVVCPASLLAQWAGEVTQHCRAAALSVCTHHGAARDTQPRRLAASDLVLTTYNILQRDNEKNGVLMKVRWSRIILDEAHIVRNHKSATSAAVSALTGARRWCLTGTPVQNKDLDVFALVKFLRCTPFDDLLMWKKWIENKSVGGQERMSTIMRCLLLRRTKQQLQQRGHLSCLPTRSEHHVEVALHMEEMNVYQKVLVFSKTLFAQFLHQRAEKQADLQDGFPPRAPGKDDPYGKMHKKMVALHGAKPVKSHEILVLLLRLRQVCCHCGLIAAMLESEEGPGAREEDAGGLDLLSELNKLTLEDDKDKSTMLEEDDEDGGGGEEGTTAAEAIRSVLSPSNPVFHLERRSSKIEAVVECLTKNVFSNKGEKAVVVSQWTSVLRLVERELTAASVRTVTLSGQVPVPQRANIVDTFNNPQSSVRVMLLSLCAGGVGLNLCGGNHLLLLDPHWNPQLEQQAQDRIYRVGQKKPVHIYRFMCKETVEQSIRKLQEQKLEVAESVLTGAKNTNASKLSIEDLKLLFNMGAA